MLDCPRCGRRVPEVLGAPEQVCPHCGAYIVGRPGAARATPAAPAGPAIVVAPAAPPVVRADAAGAFATGFRVYGRHFPRLLLAWLPLLAIDLALSLGLLAWQGANAVDVDAVEDVKVGVRLLGAFLPPYLVLWAARIAYWSVAARLVADALDGRAPAVGDAVRALASRARVVVPLAGALVVLYLAGGILVAVPAFVFYYGAVALSPATVALLLAVTLPLVIPFFLFVHWYLFAPAAAMAEGETVAGALAKSRAFARARKTTGFMLAVLALVGGAFAVGFALSDLAPAAGGGAAGEIVFAVVSWLLAPLSACVVAAFWILGAREATAPASTGLPAAEAAEPLPAAIAVRNTKCPGCARVFAFTPSADGSPARVQCPGCGRTGLVR